MRRAPQEFADLLTPRGRRLLEGRLPGTCGALGRPGAPFVALGGLLEPGRAAALRDLLDTRLLGTLVRMEDPIPAESVSGMVHNYAELLPKTVRVRTALLESRRARSFQVAEEVGLVRLLRSESFRRFAEALAGAPLRRRWGVQALCYGPGDYAGPHNDHHPEEPGAREGYLDVHLSLTLPGVRSQWLVWAHEGHFSRMVSVATVGGVTAYRLPFWHYTTPLQARRGQEARARRWVLLGTFLFQGPTPG